mmetsp:Transcript_63546/g.151559  ORF Transcript_63546/g.151559 Transcript_63546/m.151559 type:complete len:587 (+) Transcript_63546:60-1820(+)
MTVRELLNEDITEVTFMKPAQTRKRNLAEATLVGAEIPGKHANPSMTQMKQNAPESLPHRHILSKTSPKAVSKAQASQCRTSSLVIFSAQDLKEVAERAMQLEMPEEDLQRFISDCLDAKARDRLSSMAKSSKGDDSVASCNPRQQDAKVLSTAGINEPKDIGDSTPMCKRSNFQELASTGAGPTRVACPIAHPKRLPTPRMIEQPVQPLEASPDVDARDVVLESHLLPQVPEPPKPKESYEQMCPKQPGTPTSRPTDHDAAMLAEPIGSTVKHQEVSTPCRPVSKCRRLLYKQTVPLELRQEALEASRDTPKTPRHGPARRWRSRSRTQICPSTSAAKSKQSSPSMPVDAATPMRMKIRKGEPVLEVDPLVEAAMQVQQQSPSLSRTQHQIRMASLQCSTPGVFYRAEKDKWMVQLKKEDSRYRVQKSVSTGKYKTTRNTWIQARALAMQEAIKLRKQLEAEYEATHAGKHAAAKKKQAKPRVDEKKRVKALIAAKGGCYYHKELKAYLPQIQTVFDKLNLPYAHPKNKSRHEVEEACKLALASIREFQDALRAGLSIKKALAAQRAAAAARGVIVVGKLPPNRD